MVIAQSSDPNTLEIRQAIKMVDQAAGRTLDTVISHAQLILLRATPVLIVPDAPAGYMNILDELIMICPAGTAYTESTDNIVVEYEDGTDIMTVETTGFIDQTTIQVRRQAPEFVTVATPVVESGIQIKNSGDGEIAGGVAGKGLHVRAKYHLVPTSLA